MTKECSEAAIRNREPILERLRALLTAPAAVLEIGAGTGQHAAFFSRHLPHLAWLPTDLAPRLPSIRAWLAEEGGPGAREPIALDLYAERWAIGRFDVVYCANTVHYVGWEAVEGLFARLPDVLAERATLILYGPFKYGGAFTTESNEAFDAWLKARDASAGVRDVEVIDERARLLGFTLQHDFAMPANNQLLVWSR